MMPIVGGNMLLGLGRRHRPYETLLGPACKAHFPSSRQRIEGKIFFMGRLYARTALGIRRGFPLVTRYMSHRKSASATIDLELYQRACAEEDAEEPRPGVQPCRLVPEVLHGDYEFRLVVWHLDLRSSCDDHALLAGERAVRYRKCDIPVGHIEHIPSSDGLPLLRIQDQT